MTQESDRVEKLLQELQHREAWRRKAAAEALGELGASGERIVRALEAVAEGDANRHVRLAAQQALRAPAHQPWARFKESPPPPASAKPAASPANPERDEARRLYLFSLWSPLVMLFGICLGPLVFALPVVMILLLLAALHSRSPFVFVRWHVGQWSLITLPAFLVVGFSWFSSYDFWSSEFAVIVLFIVVGWYLGIFLSLQQVNRGECWLWGWLASSAELPRPWAAAAATSGESVAPASAEARVRDDPRLALERGRSALAADRRAVAVECFLVAYRHGAPALRASAVAELEKLGEVEAF